MQTASPDISKQSVIQQASDHGERCRPPKWQNKAELIAPSPGSSTSPTSSVDAELRVRPQIQEVHPAGREVLEFVRQCSGMGGFYIVLETAAQGVLITSLQFNDARTWTAFYLDVSVVHAIQGDSS